MKRHVFLFLFKLSCYKKLEMSWIVSRNKFPKPIPFRPDIVLGKVRKHIVISHHKALRGNHI